MGRRSHSQALHLWANGEYVGRWTINASGTAELQYDLAWRRSPRANTILQGLLNAAHALERMAPS